jgi:hypothetical protein
MPDYRGATRPGQTDPMTGQQNTPETYSPINYSPRRPGWRAFEAGSARSVRYVVAMPYLTNEDVTNYGPDLVDFAHRAAVQAVAPHLQELERENADLHARLARQAQHTIDQALDSAVPSMAGQRGEAGPINQSPAIGVCYGVRRGQRPWRRAFVVLPHVPSVN